MSSSKLIQDVANYCWSHNFLTVFTNFFKDYAEEFIDAPPYLEGGEHNLRHYALFEKYLKVYEETLETYLNSIDCTIGQFYQEVKLTQLESDDPYLQKFVECLLASAEYPSFYKVMAREGLKLKMDRMRGADSKESGSSFERMHAREDKGRGDDAYGAKSEGKESK